MGPFRSAAGSIATGGVVGTFLTAAGGAVVLHAASTLPWYLALLVATAVSPTDPAVVFSVLGQREIAGRSGTILEGESGSQRSGRHRVDGWSARGRHAAAGPRWATCRWQFVLQMALGAAVGVAGGRALRFMRRVTLPSEGLYPLRTLACALVCTGSPPWPTARASWPFSWPASWSVTAAPPISAKSNGSTPPWRVWPRSSRSSCSASRSILRAGPDRRLAPR